MVYLGRNEAIVDCVGRIEVNNKRKGNKMFNETEFGELMDYYTGKYIRPATEEEQEESRKAGPEGVILVDGKSVYVQD